MKISWRVPGKLFTYQYIPTPPMALKIKAQKEDFIVDEIADLPLKRRGDHAVFRLKKWGWKTVDALLDISRRFKIPTQNLSYGGKKDSNALTSQYISIPGHPPEELEDFKAEGYSLSLQGFMDRAMGPDLIEGNQFTVVVRKLEEVQAKRALQEIPAVELFGYPNYFDDQRFVGYEDRQGFIAEKILKAHYSGAFKIYFTAIHSEDSKDQKERKKFFFEHWKDWPACLASAQTEFEKEAFETLQKDPNASIFLLQRISKEKLFLIYSAYQSFIWNEVLRRIILKENHASRKVYAGVAGDYVFYSHLNQDHQRHLTGLKIPTLSARLHVSDQVTSRIYNEVLHDQEIKRALFSKIKLRQVFFQSTERGAIIKPQNIHAAIAADQLYTGKKQVTFKFFLPPGSSSTMLIKRLFAIAHSGSRK